MMYEDDTSLFFYKYCIQSHKEYTLNQELQKVYKWLSANKLKLNVAKTKYMIFSKQNKNINPIYLNINNNIIEHIHQFNFLGLYFKFEIDIEEISTKMSRTIGVLKKYSLQRQKHTIKHIQCTYSATD